MSYFFDIVTFLVGLVLTPFRRLPAVAGIALLALVTAVFALLIYKKFSNQEGITRAKKRIFGHFFGIYLFRDNLGRIIAQFGLVMAGVGRYMTYALPPVVVIIIPIGLLCIQMQLYYGYRPPGPGEAVNAAAVFEPGSDLLALDPSLLSSPGVKVETPPVRMGAIGEAAWRLRVEKEGDYPLDFRAGGAEVGFPLRADPVLERIYPQAGRPSFGQSLLYPGGPAVPAESPFRSIRIDYPAREVPFLWFRTHWSIVYFVLALVFGLLLKKPLRVDF
ncbi:MAG: hypothetical protein P9M08_06145 [Candidatus Erginobacter occultus]|nr:hypothetical protein [Candidatus Erginobacter occultus]